MSSCSTPSLFDRKVGCIGVDMEAHSAGVETDGGIWMSGGVVEEVVYVHGSVGSSSSLVTGDRV